MGKLPTHAKNNGMFALIATTFMVVLAIEGFIIHKHANKPDLNHPDNINANLMHRLVIEKKKRLDLLKKMKYEDWLKYNETNAITIDGTSYHFFIFELIHHENEFVTRVHENKKYVNMAWDDVMKDQSENYPFIKEETNEKLIHNMYYMGLDNPVDNVLKYYWTDPTENTLVKKESTFDVWHDPNSKKTGVIGISYEISDILQCKIAFYSNKIHKSDLMIVNLIILATTCILYVFNSNKIKSFVVCVVLSIYLITFLSSNELIGSFETENSKIDTILNSIIGISFLFGVNIFILESLKKYMADMYTESGLVFSLSLLLLMIVLFKDTNYIHLSDIMADRISNQLMYNMSIFLNMIIIANYLIYMVSTKWHKEWIMS